MLHQYSALLLLSFSFVVTTNSYSVPASNDDYDEYSTYDDVIEIPLTEQMLWRMVVSNTSPTVLLPDEQPLVESAIPFTKRARYNKGSYKRRSWGSQHQQKTVCNPTRQDMMRLLVALHKAQSGNIESTVHFCNLRIPASSVLTSMRYLGKK